MNQPNSTIKQEVYNNLGISDAEYSKILEIMGREPNYTELSIFSVMWSEHCSYKSTRVHLKKLPTKAPWVICGPGENAGVIELDEKYAAIFKMESHNHPSFIEPFQGAATGVGGIMRDIFTMGARPVALMNALRFGEPNHPKTKHLVEGVVAGISHYGNCMGVPTVGGECNFDKSYNGNILVNAMCVGLADKDKIFYSAAAGIGNSVIYVGTKTGKDGIHGATMASAEFDDESEEKRPTVQVGDPFKEKLLLEACLELMATDSIVAIQDMGAAGLTSSSVEMGAKGNEAMEKLGKKLGIELWLDKVPTREDNMQPFEIMLSESQERMLMIIKPGKENLVKEIFDKWDLDSAIIGLVTDTGLLQLKMHDELVADLPLKPLADEAPVYNRPYEIQKNNNELSISNIPDADAIEALNKVINMPNIVSKEWIWQQYDHMVMNDTIVRPGSNAAVVRIHDTNKGMAISCDVNPHYCKANPFEGGKQAVAECWRNLVSTGAKPLAITNCLNFGNPEKSNIMGEMVGCLEGISAACEALSFPVVSGNVSMYNETNGAAILPTPAIGGVGLIEDLQKLIDASFIQEGEDIILIGKTEGEFGNSVYCEALGFDASNYAPPKTDLKQELKNGNFISNLIKNSKVTACKDVARGGIITTLAKMSFKNNIGAKLDTIDMNSKLLFAEDQARYIVSCKTKDTNAIIAEAKSQAIEVKKIGSTSSNIITVGDESIKIEALKAGFKDWLPNLMAS